jgi:hypothetical protein
LVRPPPSPLLAPAKFPMPTFRCCNDALCHSRERGVHSTLCGLPPGAPLAPENGDGGFRVFVESLLDAGVDPEVFPKVVERGLARIREGMQGQGQ